MTENDNTELDILKEVRDMADKAAEESLGTDESAYEAYERCAGWLQHRIMLQEKEDTTHDV